MLVENNGEISSNSAQILMRPPPSREEVLSKLGECISSLHRKLKNGRVRDGDATRLQTLRAQAYLCQVFLAGLKDKEIDEIKVRLDKLEGKKC